LSAFSFPPAGSAPSLGGASPSSNVIDAHLSVQATIRSYQVRGHLAAQIDPLDLNNMNKEEAKRLIIRSVKVQEGDMDTVYQLPATTWIGGKVRTWARRSPQVFPLYPSGSGWMWAIREQNLGVLEWVSAKEVGVLWQVVKVLPLENGAQVGLPHSSLTNLHS